MNAQATRIRPDDPIASTDPRSRRGFLGLATAGVGAAVLAHARPAGADPLIELPLVAGADEELGYAECTVVVGTKTTATVPGLVVVVPAIEGPIVIEYASYVTSSLASGLVKLYLYCNGVPIHEIGVSVAGANGVAFLHGTKRLASSATASTYTLKIANWTTGATAKALGMPLSPTFIQIRQV